MAEILMRSGFRSRNGAVDERLVKEVEERLARILQNIGRALLVGSNVHLECRMAEEVAECRTHKGIKNTSEALKRLGLEKFDK